MDKIVTVRNSGKVLSICLDQRMITTVHIPPEILRKVDARDKALNVSRNRSIVETLEKALSDNSIWSLEFLEFLHSATPIDSGNEFLKGIISNRR